METETMGRVAVAATVENAGDLWTVQQGLIRPEQVHRVDIPDALVDTGAAYLSMPLRLIRQLGFDNPFRTRQVRTTSGVRSAGVYGPVRLTIMERFCSTDVVEVPDDCPVLIGQVPLEMLDWVVDTKNQRLIGNPEHGGEHMIDLY